MEFKKGDKVIYHVPNGELNYFGVFNKEGVVEEVFEGLAPFVYYFNVHLFTSYEQ